MIDWLLSDSAMAFSGEILSLEDVKACILGPVLQSRPVEMWLSSRKHVARLGDIFTASRLINLVEYFMRQQGKAEQTRRLLQTKQQQQSSSSHSSSRSDTKSPTNSTHSTFLPTSVLCVLVCTGTYLIYQYMIPMDVLLTMSGIYSYKNVF